MARSRGCGTIKAVALLTASLGLLTTTTSVAAPMYPTDSDVYEAHAVRAWWEIPVAGSEVSKLYFFEAERRLTWEGQPAGTLVEIGRGTCEDGTCEITTRIRPKLVSFEFDLGLSSAEVVARYNGHRHWVRLVGINAPTASSNTEGCGPNGGHGYGFFRQADATGKLFDTAFTEDVEARTIHGLSKVYWLSDC